MSEREERDVAWVDAPVTGNARVNERYRLLTLSAPERARRCRPGQFVMLHPFEGDDPLLPRPMAVYGWEADGKIQVLYMIAGRGTAVLAELEIGGRCRVLGPLGVPWRAAEGADAHVAVGGGTGIAAVRVFFRTLPAKRRIFLMGGRDRSGLAPEGALALRGCDVRAATDNGEEGFRGTVVGLLETILDGELKGAKAAIYAAGPTRMMAAAAKAAKARGLKCQVSLEAFMACGLGVCRACVITGCKPHPKTGLKRRAVCVDGPVMDAEEINWEEMGREK
jgi:dihydroorotate dehydrogenase electron transfer subunit